MDCSGGWGQNRGSQGAGRQGNNGKMGNLILQEGELPIVFPQEDGHPRVRETYRS